MPRLYLLDPEPAAAWSPFQAARPVAELRAGAWLIRERWEAIADEETTELFVPSHLYRFVEDGVPPVGGVHPVEGPAVIGRSVFAPSGISVEWSDAPATLRNDGAVVGWWVPEGHRWEGTAAEADGIEIEGFPLHGAYDCLGALEHLLVADVADFTREPGDAVPDGSIVIGDPQDVVLLGATVEPGVTFDVRAGAVVVEQHAYVHGGARLEGPLYVGPGSSILGGAVGWSAIGPQCRVRGEVTHAVFLGYANKAHDGFLGHSVVGRWANLGAGTITSNLKNTYGSVRLDIGGQRLETNRQFLGSLIGDHAKTAIGTLLATGTVLGVGANVFGSVRPPKEVRPFAWGTDGDIMALDGFLRIVERVLPRRNVEVTDAMRAMLETVYKHATGT